MADKAHVWTDKKINTMSKHIKSMYKTAEQEMKAKWDAYMDYKKIVLQSYQDAVNVAKKSGDLKKIAEATTAYKKQLNTVMMKDQWYKDMVSDMAKGYTNATKTATDYINGNLASVYCKNFNLTMKQIGDAVQGYHFDLVDANTIQHLAQTTDKSLLPFYELNDIKDNTFHTRNINSQILQGILQGESIPQISKRLSNVTGMATKSATLAARTACTSAENRGRQDSYERAEEDGVVLVKMWLATKDERTRDTHIEADGQVVDIDKPFIVGNSKMMYPGDPAGEPCEVYNCRCTTITKVKGFKKVK